MIGRLTSLAIGLEILIGSTPFVPRVSTAIWGGDMPGWAKTLTAAGCGLLVVLTALVNAHLSGLKEDIEELAASGNDGDGELVRDDEFYRQFLAAIRGAKESVQICYLAPYPPAASNVAERDTYYDDVEKLIESRNDLKFRRIIRKTPDNIEWIKGLVRLQQSLPNASIALLKSQPSGQQDPHALSVQVIDDTDAWLVAVVGHERTGAFRDLHLRGKHAGKALSTYYERLWKHSELLLDSGRLTKAGTAFLDEDAKV